MGKVIWRKDTTKILEQDGSYKTANLGCAQAWIESVTMGLNQR
jgi:hypothetical protein